MSINSVKLELRDTDKGITGVLDVSDVEDFPFTLNFALADIKNIDARTGTFTKNFRIPLTSTNKATLNHIYIAGSDQNDTKGKIKCHVIVNDAVTIRGEFQVKRFISTRDHKFAECVFFGDNAEWIRHFNGIDLTDLSWPSLTYDKSTIEDSWTKDQSQLDYYFPIISYGQWIDVDEVSVEDLRPSLYFLNILEKAFTDAGYTLDSTFLNSSDFTNKVLPFVGDRWRQPSGYGDDKDFEVERTSDQRDVYNNPAGQTTQHTKKIPWDNIIDGANFGSNEYTAPESVEVRFTGTVRGIIGGGGKNKVLNDFIVYIKNETTGVIIWENQFDATSMIGREKDIPIDTGLLTVDKNDSFALYYTFAVDNRLNSVDVNVSIDIKGNSNTSWENAVTRKIVRGQTFDLNDVLPKINLLDLINGIRHLYNLHFYTDNATRTVSIEPRDDFYDSPSNAVDWSKKLDISRNYETTHNTDYKRDRLFAFANDPADENNNERNKIRGREAGSFEYNFPDRFRKGRDRTENPLFAYTYHFWDKKSLRFDNNRPDGPLIANMWQKFGSNPPEPFYDFTPRFLEKIVQNQPVGGSDNRKIAWEGGELTNLPLAIQDGFDRYTSLHNSYSSRTASDGTEQPGFVETHYAKTLKIIEDNVLLSAWFYLDNADILNLDLRKPVYLSGPEDIAGYWIINKVIDYKATDTEVTKVELYKIMNFDPVPTSSWEVGDSDEAVLQAKEPDEREHHRWNAYSKGNDAEPKSSDDPGGKQSGYEYSQPSIRANNGTDNRASKGTAGIAWGQFVRAPYKHQSVYGRYNRDDSGALMVIGAGRSDDSRTNAMAVRKDGSIRHYGGEVKIQQDGKTTAVMNQQDGESRPVYRSDNHALTD